MKTNFNKIQLSHYLIYNMQLISQGTLVSCSTVRRCRHRGQNQRITPPKLVPWGYRANLLHNHHLQQQHRAPTPKRTQRQRRPRRSIMYGCQVARPRHDHNVITNETIQPNPKSHPFYTPPQAARVRMFLAHAMIIKYNTHQMV